jgi:hypothetical protein
LASADIERASLRDLTQEMIAVACSHFKQRKDFKMLVAAERYGGPGITTTSERIFLLRGE